MKQTYIMRGDKNHFGPLRTIPDNVLAMKDKKKKKKRIAVEMS